jgi:hypothetical protein
MDKEKRDWSWLPAFMPRTRALLVEKKRELGEAHVNECWKRGVQLGLPGYFFAREGVLAVGLPWGDVADLVNVQPQKGQALIALHTAPLPPLETADGAH